HKKGDDSAMKALDEAINSPLLNIESITLARSIIIHFVFNPNFPIHRMNEIMHYIKNSADLGAKCITGTVWSEEMEEDEVKITVIATGFEPKVKKVIQDIELEEIVKEKTTDATWFDKMINKWF
ncbi:MAG: hypothetical protein U9Q83_00390, partial [Bacteroidota bacterium]|nr:hypothetical protein [Bacteroidota bacterium]